MSMKILTTNRIKEFLAEGYYTLKATLMASLGNCFRKYYLGATFLVDRNCYCPTFCPLFQSGHWEALNTWCLGMSFTIYTSFNNLKGVRYE